MTAILKKNGGRFLTGKTVAPGHPKTMHDAKMWPCRPEMSNLCNQQVHFVEDR